MGSTPGATYLKILLKGGGGSDWGSTSGASYLKMPVKGGGDKIGEALQGQPTVPSIKHLRGVLPKDAARGRGSTQNRNSQKINSLYALN